jgi:hypothetical protein
MHAVHHCGAHADKRKMVISFSTRLRTEAWTARQGQLAGSKASYEVTKGMHTRCAAEMRQATAEPEEAVAQTGALHALPDRRDPN